MNLNDQNMKSRMLLAVVFISMFSSSVLSQNSKATLLFKNGTELKGYAKIKTNGAVKFRKTQDEKPKKYTFDDLKMVKILVNEKYRSYVLVDVVGEKTPKVLEQVMIGKVCLYKKVTNGYNHGFTQPGYGNGGPVMAGGGRFYSIKNYYVRREGEGKATHLGSTNLFSKNFKKAATSFFKDCPLLVEKINKREYRKKDLKNIVSFYNNNCQN